MVRHEMLGDGVASASEHRHAARPIALGPRVKEVVEQQVIGKDWVGPALVEVRGRLVGTSHLKHANALSHHIPVVVHPRETTFRASYIAAALAAQVDVEHDACSRKGCEDCGYENEHIRGHGGSREVAVAVRAHPSLALIDAA